MCKDTVEGFRPSLNHLGYMTYAVAICMPTLDDERLKEESVADFAGD